MVILVWPEPSTATWQVPWSLVEQALLEERMGPWKRMTHGAGELDDFQISPASPSLLCGREDASVASLGLALGPLVGFSQWEVPQGDQIGGEEVRVGQHCTSLLRTAAPSHGPSTFHVLMTAPSLQASGCESSQLLLSPAHLCNWSLR